MLEKRAFFGGITTLLLVQVIFALIPIKDPKLVGCLEACGREVGTSQALLETFSFIFLLAYILSLVGLYFFNAFCRIAFLACVFIGCIFAIIAGGYIPSGLEAGLGYIAGILEGYLLFAMYFSPLRERFYKRFE